MRVLQSVSFLAIFMVVHGLFAGDVTINEIMYNSPGDTDIEWVELTNNSAAAVALNGWYLIDDNDDHTHCALSGTLERLPRAVIWSSPESCISFRPLIRASPTFFQLDSAPPRTPGL